MPPLPTCSRPASNCGLTRMTASVSAGAAANTGPSSSVAEMNETSMTSRVRFWVALLCSQALRRKKARIGTLHEADARVVAQLHGNLAEAGIDGGDMRRAVLQQAVGESASRGANVEAGSARYGDLPVVERRRQLEAAAAHVGQVFAEQADGRVQRNGRARLVDLLFAHQDTAGKDERARTFAAGNEPPLDQ